MKNGEAAAHFFDRAMISKRVLGFQLSFFWGVVAEMERRGYDDPRAAIDENMDFCVSRYNEALREIKADRKKLRSSVEAAMDDVLDVCTGRYKTGLRH